MPGRLPRVSARRTARVGLDRHGMCERQRFLTRLRTRSSGSTSTAPTSGMASPSSTRRASTGCGCGRSSKMLSVNLDAPPLVRDLRVRCMRGLWQHAGPLSPSARELRPCGRRWRRDATTARAPLPCIHNVLLRRCMYSCSGACGLEESGVIVCLGSWKLGPGRRPSE